jgi:uncharacterized membrane protein (UPF0127 family)
MYAHAILALLTLAGSVDSEVTPSPHGSLESALIGAQAIHIRVAADSDSRYEGLVGVARLGENEGMLFLYPQARTMRFWMQGCLIPLDIAYLDSSFRVLSIKTCKAPPPNPKDHEIDRAPSPGAVQTVLEMPGGWFKQKGIGVGAQLILSPRLLRWVAK